MSQDAGLALVEHLRALFEPAAPALLDAPRGFTWRIGDIQQCVNAEPLRRAAGLDIARVSADCELVHGVQGVGAQLGAIARWNAREAGLSSLRWNAETGVVSLRCAVLAHDAEVPAAASRLAHAALLQLGAAAAARSPLVAELGGTSAPLTLAEHPDAALLEAWRAYADAGLKPGAWDGAGALQEAAAMQPPPWLRVRVDAAGLHAELPAALEQGPQPGSAPGAGVALLRLIAGQPHPRLGAGLLAVLEPPADAEPVRERVAATAALLNEGESREWSGVDQLGAWCVHPDRGLVFVVFVPALACAPGIAQTMAWQMAMRAAWSRRFLAQVAQLRTPPGA
jgi:hypothetical protein